MRYAAVISLALSIVPATLPAKAPVPRPAKEFAFSGQNGKRIALSGFKGKVVVVQFLILPVRIARLFLRC
jgi:hypothetical protein